MMQREVLFLRTEPEMRDAIRYLADKGGTSMTTVLWVAVKDFLDRKLPSWSKVNINVE